MSPSTHQLDEQQFHDANLRVYQERGDREAARDITQSIRAEEKRLRERFPILNRQSLLGAAWFAAAALGFAASTGLYIAGIFPAWLTIALSAICVSLIREIEHDLIHDLYFKQHPRLKQLMMLCVWPFLGNIPNPWFRRKVHLLHHRASGQHEDVEERYIGNGMRHGLLRLLTTIDPGIAAVLRHRELRAIPAYNTREVLLHSAPVVFFYYVVWLSFLSLGLVWLATAPLGIELSLPGWLSACWSAINTLAVVYVFPNLLRQVCLQILSSNMHYYGDVENRLQETQVLSAWYFLPLQLFTCNFGSTHTIHHFAVNQPFYLRQMVAPAAHAALRRHGVRFNDVGTFLRANRYNGGHGESHIAA
jgi:fatty acid desaturase